MRERKINKEYRQKVLQFAFSHPHKMSEFEKYINDLKKYGNKN